MSTAEHLDHDEQRLAELGYVQRLQRGWSSFQNFAISFTIISIFAGTFTTFGQAWNYGGPIAISIGWPVICGLILLVAFSMAELASKYPTAGGLYYWASDMGGRTWGWFTGWFNFIGLVGIVASVIYGSATFLTTLLGLYKLNVLGVNFGDDKHFLAEAFGIFVILLGLHAVINIYSSHLVALLNSVSVWWHVVGVLIVIGILVIAPDSHQSASFVFGHKENNSGFGGGMFWFYVLPLGFLLTMYTQTGYDASAHISEETTGAAKGAAQGVWRSVFWSGVFGWFVLLALTFAATDVKAVNEGGGSSIAIIESALSSSAAKFVILLATVGQLFCGMSCVTSASRMCYAFSRDRAVPGHQMWTRLNRHRVPYGSVLLMCALALIITLPALKGAPGTTVPWAFFAVVLIATIGLYIAYVMPTYLRWRMGDSFVPGPWTLGKKYKWINPAAIIWVGICVICFSLPFTPAGWPWSDEKFQWEAVNYAPGVLILVGLIAVWWKVSAHKWFHGPIREVELPDETGRIPESAPRLPGSSLGWMGRPVIGICAALERARWGAWDTPVLLSPRNYSLAVQREGAIALMLSPDERVAEDPDQLLDMLDGLILAGGSDVDPATYGAEPHAETKGTNEERDRFEVALARAALERDMPVLGICRGMQMLNVACGGTLVQHLDDVATHRHTPGEFCDHEVELEPESLAARAAGNDHVAVKSHHHQGVDRVGAGLEVTGRNPGDGVVEAIEHPDRQFALGVLWHPEEDEQSRVIGALVEQARMRAGASR